MRFPLNHKEQSGYKFMEPTFYNTYHTGTDWVANLVPLYAPISGNIVSRPWDYGGGQWVNFQADDGTLHLFAHLSNAYAVGRYAEGQQIGVTGNTGGYTTGAHLHEQIYRNGILINPEGYYKENTMPGLTPQNLRTDIDFLANEVRPQLAKLRTDIDFLAKESRDNDSAMKAQLDRIETTLAKVLSDEVLQEAKISGIKVEPQKGFWELFTNWINGFKKEK